MPKTPKKPYHKEKFEAFLGSIREGQGAHWLAIANALGVDNTTINSWRRMPEAQQAIREGAAHALACMQQSGARDWKMWESKLKMLGINPSLNLDVTSGGEKINQIKEMSDDELRERIERLSQG